MNRLDSEDYEDKLFLIDENAIKCNKNKDFTSLDAWKRAREVKLFFYEKVVPSLPKGELYQLGAQIRDASISITANIAEVMENIIFRKPYNFTVFQGNHV